MQGNTPDFPTLSTLSRGELLIRPHMERPPVDTTTCLLADNRRFLVAPKPDNCTPSIPPPISKKFDSQLLPSLPQSSITEESFPNLVVVLVHLLALVYR
jgi:hypothetical protein